MSKINFLSKAVKNYLGDDQGSVVVLTALIAPVMIGGVGLGVESGHWYQKQRHLQHLADVASFSGAARLRSGGDIASITSYAESVARMSGYDPDLGNVQVNSPPLSGAYAGDEASVEVIITENRPRWFSAIYSSGDVEIVGRAVSRIEGGSTACLLALSTWEYRALEVGGSTDVTLNGCVAASNSADEYSFKLYGAANMSVDCVYTVGDAYATGGLTLTDCDGIKTNSSPVADPYADVAEPTVTGNCQSTRVGSNNKTTVVSPTDTNPNGMKSRRYCGGLSLKGTVYFESGLYIVDGGTFSINSQSKVYSKDGGVTFYLLNGATLKFNGGADVNLSAPNSGPTSGLLFFGSRSSGIGGSGSCNRNYGTEHKLNGGADLVLEGAVYLPSGDLTFNGNSDTESGCTQVIANTITLTGNSDLAIECELSGTEDIVAAEFVQLKE
ncbi:MAG: hypothetical protein JXR13_07325 [Thalassovita sp.]